MRFIYIQRVSGLLHSMRSFNALQPRNQTCNFFYFLLVIGKAKEISFQKRFKDACRECSPNSDRQRALKFRSNNSKSPIAKRTLCAVAQPLYATESLLINLLNIYLFSPNLLLYRVIHVPCGAQSVHVGSKVSNQN